MIRRPGIRHLLLAVALFAVAFTLFGVPTQEGSSAPDMRIVEFRGSGLLVWRFTATRVRDNWYLSVFTPNHRDWMQPGPMREECP